MKVLSQKTGRCLGSDWFKVPEDPEVGNNLLGIGYYINLKK